MSPEIILTIAIIIFVVFCLFTAYSFIIGEIKQEKILEGMPRMKYESPKDRRARIENKYK